MSAFLRGIESVSAQLEDHVGTIPIYMADFKQGMTWLVDGINLEDLMSGYFSKCYPTYTDLISQQQRDELIAGKTVILWGTVIASRNRDAVADRADGDTLAEYEYIFRRAQYSRTRLELV